MAASVDVELLGVGDLAQLVARSRCSEIVRNSKTCEREMIVSGILSSSVVAIMKTTCGGGSSIDFSSALNEWLRELVDLVDDEDLVAVADRRDRPGPR